MKPNNELNTMMFFDDALEGERTQLLLSLIHIWQYFPKSYTPQRMQETIIKLLEAWQKKRQRDRCV